MPCFSMLTNKRYIECVLSMRKNEKESVQRYATTECFNGSFSVYFFLSLHRFDFFFLSLYGTHTHTIYPSVCRFCQLFFSEVFIYLCHCICYPSIIHMTSLRIAISMSIELIMCTMQMVNEKNQTPKEIPFFLFCIFIVSISWFFVCTTVAVNVVILYWIIVYSLNCLFIKSKWILDWMCHIFLCFVEFHFGIQRNIKHNCTRCILSPLKRYIWNSWEVFSFPGQFSYWKLCFSSFYPSTPTRIRTTTKHPHIHSTHTYNIKLLC